MLALCLVATPSWVNYFNVDSDRPTTTYQWDFPQDTKSDEGLGGGLQWAAQGASGGGIEEFCELLLPRFVAETMGGLVDCDAIYQAVVLGFATWSANHRKINFHDLSKECKGSNPAVVPGGDNPPEEYDNECPSLEISVTAGPPLREARRPPARPRTHTRTPRALPAYRRSLRPQSHKNLAAVVYNMPKARKPPTTIAWEEGAYTTSGTFIGGARKIEVSRLHFNTDLCWYLDNSFCYGFHKFYKTDIDIEALVVALFAITFGVASLALLLYMVLSMIRCSEHGRQGLWDSIEAASHAGTFIVLLFLTMPPLCYTYIFRPCMDCYDFEAAVAHEIGHILGFHHPDVHPERNWNATVPMSSEICEDSWATAELTGVDLAGSIAADSIMNSLTKQQARACLTLDDLNGLNYMYPTCADQLTRNGQPNCIKSKRNVGALRFAGLVAMPFMAAAALLLVIIIYANRRDAARFKRIQDNLHSVLERFQQRHEEDRSTGARKSGRRGSVASGLGRRGSIMAGFQFGRKEKREEKNAFGSAKHLARHSEAIDAVLAGNEPMMLRPSTRAAAPAAIAEESLTSTSLSRRDPSGGMAERSAPTKSVNARRRLRAGGKVVMMGSGKGSGKEKELSEGSAAGGEKSTRGALTEVSRVKGKTNLDRKLQTLNDASNAEKVEKRQKASSMAARNNWLRATLKISEDIAATSDRRGSLEATAHLMDRELAAMTTEEREEELKRRDEVRARFWRMFEPVARLRGLHLNKEMAEGPLAKAMEHVLDFPIEQLKGMMATAQERKSRQSTMTGGAAALTQKQRDDIKRAFKLKKAWYERLLKSEPGVLDYLMTAEDGKAVQLAAAMEELSDALIHADMKGPANPLNSSRREYRGLQYGPLVEASSRGALVEWLSNELLTPPENMSADERRGLALMRQLLRRLRYENDDVRPTTPSVARRPRTASSTSLPPRLSLPQRSTASSPPASPNPIPPRGPGLDPMRPTPTPRPPTPNRATTAPGVALARSPSPKRRGSSSRLSLSVARRCRRAAARRAWRCPSR